MRLYVWDDVLTDYTSGIMFAVASSVEDARRQLSEGEHEGGQVRSDLAGEPKIYRVDRRVSRKVWGGS